MNEKLKIKHSETVDSSAARFQIVFSFFRL